MDKFTSQSSTAEIHLDDAATVILNLSTTTPNKDTPVSDKHISSLVTRQVQQAFHHSKDLKLIGSLVVRGR